MRTEDIEYLRFDIGFQLGLISKSELNLLKGHDRTKSDDVKYKIADRIIERLDQSYDIVRTLKPAPAHSTTLPIKSVAKNNVANKSAPDKRE